MTNEDWLARIGEVYGSPFRQHDGNWGIAVYLTEQQEDVIRERHQACCNEDRYDEDYLKGAVAVSINKDGTERKLTITDGRRWQMQSDWNGNRTQKCGASPRTPAEDREARWDPPAASPEARRKADEATAAALEAERPKPHNEPLENFKASLRRGLAARESSDAGPTTSEPETEGPMKSTETDPGTDAVKAPQERHRAERASPPPDPRAEASAQLENLDLVASLTDHDAWTAWKEAVGELRGKPAKTEAGWGAELKPTARQTALIEARQDVVNDRLDLNRVLEFDHLKGLDAVSVDRSGRERQLTVTDSNTWGSRFNMDGDTLWTCATAPRERDRYEPTPPVIRGADRPVGGGPPELSRTTTRARSGSHDRS
ncbi:MAG: hypothetical protein OXG35_06180 [Acidobacteria bacterium]|nr:hypothetical protein [Acidobacteriota bacterium]